jgi:Ankyrin repeats (many copies)/Ankyrin repeats (3 copies)
MPEALSARPNLDWLRKTAKQLLRELRTRDRNARLADAQLALARQYGFPSWRALKAQVDRLHDAVAPDPATIEQEVARFLRHVGEGRIDAVRAMLATTPQLVNMVGPHPFWGGRPQALHVSIETKRRDMFDLLLASGADVDGDNEPYEHWSPLMLAFHWDQPDMRRILLERGAKVGVIEAMLLEDDELVETLLRAGKSALPAFEPSNGSILAFARTPFAIDRLLELGVSPDRKDRWGATPIEAMSRLGPRGQKLVRHMLARGIAAEPQEYARLGDRATLAALIAAKPEIAKSDAVMMGAVDFGHHALVQWLLKNGANVNARSGTGSGGTALHSAAWNGDLRMVKLLVAAGADVNARDPEHDNTPAGWAKVSIGVSNNPKCQTVAEYLSGLESQASA